MINQEGAVCLSVCLFSLSLFVFSLTAIQTRSYHSLLITLSPLFAGAAAAFAASAQVSEQAASSAGLLRLVLLRKRIILFLVGEKGLSGFVLERGRGHILVLVHVDKDRRILAVLGVPMVVHRGRELAGRRERERERERDREG